MSTRRRAGLVGLLAAALGAGIYLRERDPDRLPAQIRVEEVVADLSATFDREAVVVEDPSRPVAAGRLQPSSHYGDPTSGFRGAIVAPPSARLRFRVRVPPGASLRFSAGVQGPEERDRDAAGIRFGASVGGRRIFSRTINPAANRHDRRWFDERVDLGAFADRDVEIELATEADRPAVRLAGTPGWSHVRVVREVWRDRQPASTTRPSVLMLLIDTLRADRLGCYGAAPSPSPTLDRLAAGGRIFEYTVAQSSWTMQSVASLFTGLPPRSHGLGSTASDGSISDYLPDTLRTLAWEAADGGITTVGVSANPLISRATNLAQGFETFVEFGWDRARENWHPASEVNETFLRWLGRNHGRRFFAYLHYMEPHDPYTPAPAFHPPPPPGIRPAIAAGKVESIAHEINWQRGARLPPVELEYLRALYDAEIRSWDADLGVLLDGLAAVGANESTVIVVTADHGEEFLEHGCLKHRVHLYDESVHVPLVLVGPGIGPGRVREQAQGIDLFPTLAALLGVAAPPDLPGQGLLAAREPRPAISETVFGVAPDGTATRLVSLRTPAWKLIHAPAFERYELYDLARDPGERENRFGVAPEGPALARALAEWDSRAALPPRPSGPSDPALGEKLRALGYVD